MKEEAINILEPYLKHHKVQEMKQYIQHGKISTYDHCVDVAKTCFAINRKLRLGADERTLVIAALLHDMYLYDWHDNKLFELHGYHHPQYAAENAKRFFDLEETVLGSIQTHMWPLTLRKIPKSREAWILCFVDKYISTKETLFCR